MAKFNTETKNKNGLTFLEWVRAANVVVYGPEGEVRPYSTMMKDESESRIHGRVVRKKVTFYKQRVRRAWANGEDPTDWRAQGPTLPVARVNHKVKELEAQVAKLVAIIMTCEGTLQVILETRKNYIASEVVLQRALSSTKVLLDMIRKERDRGVLPPIVPDQEPKEVNVEVQV